MSPTERGADGPPERPTQWLPPALVRATPPPPAAYPAWTPPVTPPLMTAPGARTGPPTGPHAVPPRRWPAARTGRTGLWWGVAVIAAVPIVIISLLLVVAIAGLGRSRTGGPRPRSAPTSTVPTRQAEAIWTLEASTLRPDLPKASFVASISGAFDSAYLATSRSLWLILSGTPEAGDIVLHAVDPATGKQRWQRELDGALCAVEVSSSGVFCASVLGRDPDTGLGTRWRLHRIDPGTGADRVTREVDGWFTAVHQAGGQLVAVEQRIPGPRAVLSGFDGEDLAPRWTRDLAAEPGHAEMFTANRIIQRPEPRRPGLILDRPRFRDVGSGLVALWAGQRTAFVDLRSGRLVMMPHCSRLVDDGKRLWCNEVDGATAYSYDGRRLVRVRGPRLAFPYQDLTGAARSRPVFIDGDGAGVAVDPATGTVGAVYTPPGRGSAFGLVTMPAAYTAGDRTFLIGNAGTLLLRPGTDAVSWRNPELRTSELPVLLGDRALIGNSTLDLVDLSTGRSTAKIRTGAIDTLAVGDRVIGVRSEKVELLRLR